MMGHQKQNQGKLFIYNFDLESRVRQDHPLRKINQIIDFEFVYNEVKGKYGGNGNVSVPPPVILKFMLLLIYYNVRSERELMDTLPERLDWLWFLGYDLESKIPNHSVLSKARNRWGVDTFKSFFERIILQCVEIGLVDGSKLFMDSSMIQANASNNSVVDTTSLKRHLNKSYRRLESRLEENDSNCLNQDILKKKGVANRKYISTTDPDASVVRRGHGRSKLQYQVHRGVDDKCEVITATEVTPGEIHESHLLNALIENHHQNTGQKVEIVVADSKYGTMNNYLSCHDQGIAAHIQSLEKTSRGTGSKKNIFPKESFIYNRENDVFICPAGKPLKKRKYNKKRHHFEYITTSSTCENCELRTQCTQSKNGRTVKRHIRQDDLDIMLSEANSQQSRKDIRKRQHFMERSFAYATRYGFKRARWRGLDKMQIQEYLTAVIQNIKVLLKYNHKPLKEMGLKVPLKTSKIKRGIRYILKRIDFKMRLTLVSQPTLILSNFDFRPHCLV